MLAWVIGIAVALPILVIAAGRLGLLSGRAPAGLGVHEGRLARCKPTPNCVSSFADPADTIHYVAPLAFKATPEAAFAHLRDRVQRSPGARIVAERDRYLRAEFETRLLRFVDDVEFLLDTENRVIHVRSASRVGRRDLGVNRERVERLREVMRGT